MAIAIHGTPLSSNWSSVSTSFTATLPTGWSAGDVVVVAFAIANQATLTPPSGWTLAKSQQYNSTAETLYVYYRVMQAGDSNPSWSWTGGAAGTWCTIGYSGVNTSTVLDGTPSGKSNTSSTTLTSTGITTTVTG